MKRELVHIGNQSYLVEILDKSDLGYSTYKKVELYGNEKIVNDIISFTDILVVSSDDDVIPNPEVDIHSTFSDYVEGYEKIGEAEEVPCYTIRIYHPSNCESFPMIVSAYSVINNITFHWTCTKNMTSIGTSPEKKIGNNTYSEYFEVTMPIPNKILTGQAQIRYDGLIELDSFTFDKLHYYYIDDEKKKVEVQPTKIRRYITTTEKGLLSQYEQTYHVHSTDNADKWIYEKYVLPIDKKLIQEVNIDIFSCKSIVVDSPNGKSLKFIENKSMPYNLSTTIVLFPMNGKIENNTYLIDTNKTVGTWTINENRKIILSCSIGFDNGHVAAIGKFLFGDNNKTIAEYYETIHNVNLSDYKDIKIPIDKIEDENEEQDQHTEPCKYCVLVCSDKNMSITLYEHTFYSNTIDDFSMSLSGLFSDWQQVPSTMFVKLSYIDRYLGISLNSEIKLITKDDIKYAIENDNIPRLNEMWLLQEFGNDQEYVQKKYNKAIEIEMTNNHQYFIDNIRCYITRESESKNNVTKSISPRIVYKPLFYRTEDGQSISIRRNVTQNIGINLASYMTKVDSFILKIGTSSFNEIARNGIYVIFEVNGTNLEENAYDIFTSDLEYICTGQVNYK